MMSDRTNLIIDLSAVGSFKTGYYTYAIFIIDHLYSGELFPSRNILLILSPKSGLAEYISNLDLKDKTRCSIKIYLNPFVNPFLRILFCSFLISFLAIFNRKLTVFSPINYGPIFTCSRHYIFLHDLSVWGLPSTIQHRSKLSTAVIQFCISASSKCAFKILCQSNFTRNLLLHEFPELADKSSVLCLPYPTKLNQVVFKTVSTKPSFTIKRVPKSILFVSSFYPLKNQMLLIQCAQVLPDFSFTLIGSPIHKQYFQACHLLADVLPNVEILTSCDDNQLTMLYQQSEIYVQPSYFEGLSFTPLEASCHGCFLLLSDIGAHREFYSKHCLSFFNPNSLDSLINSLTTVTEDNFTKPPHISLTSERHFLASNHIFELNSIFNF